MFYTENDLWRIVTRLAQAGVASCAGVLVKRAFQPTSQAHGQEPLLLLHRYGSRRYGFQGQRYEYRPDGNGGVKLIKVEVWHKEDTYQAYALVDRAPEDEGFTAKDLLEHLGGYLQSDEGLRALKAEGLGILRISEIIETQYEDDKDTFKISFSLRFTLAYRQETESEIPAVTSIDGKITSGQQGEAHGD